MGIREEIEKLRVDKSMLTPPFPGSHLDHLQTHNEALDAVLSILDEHLGELVEEIETKSDTGFLHITISDYEPGNHIAIYRR